VVIPVVALLVGASVTYLIVKTKSGPLTGNGSPITVSGDTIHTAHPKIKRDSSTNASVDYGANLPVSLTMYGCSAAPNCTVNLTQGWKADLYSGGTLDHYEDVPDPQGAHNAVTIQANNPAYPFNMTTPGDVDQCGDGFYFTAIAVTLPSGPQPPNLSCSNPRNCSIVIA